MKDKKVAILTICVVVLVIAVIGLSVFCIYIMNKGNSEAVESIVSQEDTEADEPVTTVKDTETDLLTSEQEETTDNSSQETDVEPATTPEPTVAPNIKQAELHRNYHNDNLTADLLEKGYFYEVAETQSDDNFEVNLVGFSGDTLNPMILLDVTVKDETLLSEEDRMYIEVYCLGTYQYENSRDSYGTLRAYGVRDAENSRLFHVSMQGYSKWLTFEEEFVIGDFSIFIGSGEEIDFSWDEYDVNMEYRLTVPKSTFKPVIIYGYEDTTFEVDGLTFYLDTITLSYYYTTLDFYADCSNTKYSNADQDGNLFYALYEKRDSIIEDLVLTINGTDYKGTIESAGPVTFNNNKCYFYVDLPGMDNKLLYSMAITKGETNYELK